MRSEFDLFCTFFAASFCILFYHYSMTIINLNGVTDGRVAAIGEYVAHLCKIK
jgi:hypothetical protein